MSTVITCFCLTQARWKLLYHLTVVWITNSTSWPLQYWQYFEVITETDNRYITVIVSVFRRWQNHNFAPGESKFTGHVTCCQRIIPSNHGQLFGVKTKHEMWFSRTCLHAQQDLKLKQLFVHTNKELHAFVTRYFFCRKNNGSKGIRIQGIRCVISGITNLMASR